jgi:serine/threonine-protein kinase HipA
VEWLTDLQIADLLRQVRADHTAWLGARAEGRWSLAGAQPKIALLHQDNRWGRPHGQTPTTHILKPAIAGLDGHDLNEHLRLRTARLLRLRAARSIVVDFAGDRAVVVTRYDRLRTESGVTRIHQEDMCQALGVHPEHKYESDGGPSAAAIAKLLAAHISGRAGESERRALAAALAFNWLIGAPDAHAKNFGLLLSGRQVRLAPLYDVASVLPYDDLHEPKLRMAMRIGRTYEAARMNAAHWQEEAGRLRVDPEWLLSQVRKMAEQLPDALAEACADPDISALASPLPARLLERVRA